MVEVEYLIVGGGYAGDTAATTLRKLGAKGRVMMVSAEHEYPYMRYTLSKEFILGKRQRNRVYLHRPGFYQEHGIEVRLGVKVASLDNRSRKVMLDTGEDISFDKLLLATGAWPRKLAMPGAELPGVYYLRTLGDSEAIRQEAMPGRRAVIVGGGFIGAEVASSLTQMGVETTVVEVASTIWAHLFGEEIGRFFHQGLERRGVRILGSAHVQSIEGSDRARTVVTQEGHEIPCDFVAIGIGVHPTTELAQNAGLKVDNGVVVNQYLETSEPGIFAAGDNARFFSSIFARDMRIEHWDVAAQQGAIVARNMLGEHAPFDQVPYFFSGLFDMWLEFLGYAPKWEQLTIRRLSPERFTAFFTEGPYVKGALLVNNAQELRLCRDLIKRQAAIENPARLGDLGLDLATVAA